MSPARMSDQPAVLYIGSALPSRSETFVYREVLGLRERGWAVQTASVHPPDRNLGEPALEALADEAINIYGDGGLRMLGRAFREACSHPMRALATLGDALRCALGADDISSGKRPKIVWQALAALSIAGHVRKRGIRHIHAHMAHVPTTIGMFLARHLECPFSFTGHAADLFRDRALLSTKLRRAVFCACISEWHRKFYQAIVPRDDADLPIIRCGVDTDQFAATDHIGDDGAFSILAVGRLVPKKGFDVLIDAIAMLEERSVQCTIMGGGPDEAALRTRIHAKGQEHVITMTGAASNTDVRRAVQQADLFVLPCRVSADGDRDGIPVVLMEAMACSVPVISGDLETIRELVEHDVTGAMVQPGNADALARAMHELMRDDDRRTRLARNGRARVEEEFSQRTNIARLERAIRQAHGCVVNVAGSTGQPEEAEAVECAS